MVLNTLLSVLHNMFADSFSAITPKAFLQKNYSAAIIATAALTVLAWSMLVIIGV